ADTDQNTPPAPYATNTLVKDGDIKILAWVGVGAMLVLVLFGLVLGQTGLLEFPSLTPSASERDYYSDSLIYRERRMVLGLVMRTFLTGFSFVVGLALCTMGGLFILRQVTSLTAISGSLGSGKAGFGLLADDGQTAKTLKDSQFAFSSYSPGVLFMLGGVAIMGITQLLAIPVRSVEIMPSSAVALCLSEDSANYAACMANVATGETQSAGQIPISDTVTGTGTDTIAAANAALNDGLGTSAPVNGFVPTSEAIVVPPDATVASEPPVFIDLDTLSAFTIETEAPEFLIITDETERLFVDPQSGLVMGTQALDR
ncbi:MAG: hypothetical protein KJP02_10280, partial [Octadecabacter sp.]|nr:hypothetical protein [Octadecabacter sp.]